jgi:hypothetical protein
MSKEVAKAVLESGIVDKDALAQLQRWGHLTDVEISADEAVTATGIAQRIIDAIESKDEIELRSTDLDIIKDYLKSRRRARLHVPSPEREGQTVGIPVEYSSTKMGEIVIPWTSESINDQLLNEDTYLKPTGGPRIYFADVRELFYGDHKAFVVCTPARGK